MRSARSQALASSTYTVVTADAGSSLVPVVTATNAGGSTSTSSSGSCDTGEVVAGLGVGNAPTPTAAPAGCSPISAVVATTQAGETFCTNSVTILCGYADPMNQTVGVPAGTTLSTTGACAAWASGGTVSTAGTTITGCRISGHLTVTASNVTRAGLRVGREMTQQRLLTK